MDERDANSKASVRYKYEDRDRAITLACYRSAQTSCALSTFSTFTFHAEESCVLRAKWRKISSQSSIERPNRTAALSNVNIW